MSSSPLQNNCASETTESQASVQTERRPSASKAPKPPPAATKTDSETLGSSKPSNKELKERAKAEKAAKRAREKQQSADQVPPIAKQTGEKGIERTSTTKVVNAKALPHRPAHQRKASVEKNGIKTDSQLQSQSEHKGNVEPILDQRRVAHFEHLYGPPKRVSIAGASREVHPAILALGLQISRYNVCGSTSRCVATLRATQQVIELYSTPVGNSLPRHLTTHLTPQFDYLASCRPLSASQGAAIRWLKVLISALDPGQPEHEAKQRLCAEIDQFIQEKILVAGDVIATNTAARIKPKGDIILTFAKSAIVEKSLVKAHQLGKRFSVIVIDSRPLMEGKSLAQALIELEIPVQYAMFSDLTRYAPLATKCLLGAHSMMAHGALYSRAGTGLVAMMAKDAKIPVIVCCESLKISDCAAQNSFVHNEIAPPDELIDAPHPDHVYNTETSTGKHAEINLRDWQSVPGLKLLNLMYDLTPASLIDVVITEFGDLPPSSVSAVQRLGIT